LWLSERLILFSKDGFAAMIASIGTDAFVGRAKDMLKVLAVMALCSVFTHRLVLHPACCTCSCVLYLSSSFLLSLVLVDSFDRVIAFGWMPLCSSI
jgi:hypothetical protein